MVNNELKPCLCIAKQTIKETTKELIKSLRAEAANEEAETAAIMREAADLLEQLVFLIEKAKIAYKEEK